MEWIEASVYTTTEGIEPVTGRLMQIGINGFSIVDAEDFNEFLAGTVSHWDYVEQDLMALAACETCVKFYLADNEQGREQLGEVRRSMRSLAEADEGQAFGRLAVELNNVREEDWENNWKQYFRPFPVGERLYVKPSWEQAEGAEGRKILEIDPASSFGTGQHHTTRLCLEMVEECVRQGQRVLDMGCGSGILSIAALLLGAEHATGVDIDENSVHIAQENCSKNGMGADRFDARCGDVLSDEALLKSLGNGYDVILANIVADVLRAMAPLFAGLLRPGGTLVVSGIIEERTDEVRSAILAQCLREVEHRTAGGWAALRFIK